MRSASPASARFRSGAWINACAPLTAAEISASVVWSSPSRGAPVSRPVVLADQTDAYLVYRYLITLLLIPELREDSPFAAPPGQRVHGRLFSVLGGGVVKIRFSQCNVFVLRIFL